MKWIKRICVLLLLTVVFFWGMLFTSENTAQVALSLVFWQSNPANMSLWLILGFAAGGLLGLLLSMLLLAKLRAGLHHAERRAQLFEKEIATLRANVIVSN